MILNNIISKNSKIFFDEYLIRFIFFILVYFLVSSIIFYTNFRLHNEIVVLIITFLINIFFYKSFKLKTIGFINFRNLIIIVIVSLLFKLNPFPWVGGAQDQGLYVNMHKAYENGVFQNFRDKNFDFLIEEDLGDYYKIRQSDPGSYLWRKDEILNKNLEKDNKYVPKSDFELHGYTDFQFLPFTSLIFKTFSFYFGKENWKYGLTFFSILSSIIVFIILRSFLNEGYSLIGVLFLNFNPLLNFFFKFPVSESFTFFYFLSLIYSVMCIFKNYNHNFFLLFNSFSISSIFLIRIDAIFYLYNFLIFFSILIFSSKNYRYYFYILFTILLFLLISQVHLNFNEHYVGGIYSHFFRIDILKNPISLLIAIIALFFILERIFFLLPNKLIEKVFDNLNLIIIFFIFLSFLNLLLLMKGISFQKNILVTTERGFQFINYSKLVSIFYYLNLVLFPVILFKSKDIFIRSLFIIFLFWFIWHTLIEPSRGYDFYYSRYLFPNIFLIFQLLFLININIIFKSRLLKTTFIICFLLYSIYSIKQITNTEYKNAYIELKKVNLKYSNDKTIFAIYNSNTNQWRGSYFHNRVKLPLKFFFNNYVISFNDDNFSFLNSKSLSIFENKIILSDVKLDYKKLIFLEERIFEEIIFEHSRNRPPLNYKDRKFTYYLYKYKN